MIATAISYPYVFPPKETAGAMEEERTPAGICMMKAILLPITMQDLGQLQLISEDKSTVA